MSKSNGLAKEANEHSKGMGMLSSHVWEQCCMKFGSGGTKESNVAYEKIMSNILEVLEVKD